MTKKTLETNYAFWKYNNMPTRPDIKTCNPCFGCGVGCECGCSGNVNNAKYFEIKLTKAINDNSIGECETGSEIKICTPKGMKKTNKLVNKCGMCSSGCECP
jgi:hypothetical protein